jgi:PAS domain-containing protein
VKRLRTANEVGHSIAHISFEGRHLLVNGKYCKMLGSTQEELLAADNTDVFKGSFGPPLTSQLLEELLAGAVDHYFVEQQFLRKNGDPL